MPMHKLKVIRLKNCTADKKRHWEKELVKKIMDKTSTNFINNLYVGVKEASNPLSHRKSSTTSSPNRYLVTQRLFFRCLNHPIWIRLLRMSSYRNEIHRI